MKYAIKIAYSGKNYSGWQVQDEANSIQEEIEKALYKISGEKIRITGAGRTDKGVNAIGQVASFSTSKIWKPDKLVLAMNFHLPDDIRIMRAHEVNEDFNARYSAKSREYKYFIYEGISCPPFISDYVWWRKSLKRWDMRMARQAYKVLEGEHDFRAFCRETECPENSVRTLYKVSLKKFGSFIILTVRGKSFLTNMVRIISGNLNLIATGERDLSWLKILLEGKSRQESGMTAPAQGLFFWKVEY